MRYCSPKLKLNGILLKDDCFYIWNIYIKNEILKCLQGVRFVCSFLSFLMLVKFIFVFIRLSKCNK